MHSKKFFSLCKKSLTIYDLYDNINVSNARELIKMTKEQEIQNFMVSLGISRQEAEQLWEDDNNDFIGDEGEEMQKKAKEIRRYEKKEVTATKEKKPKERKIDNDKLYLLSAVKELFGSMNIDSTMKTETELSFSYNGAEYTFKLTKHRPPKK